MLPQKLVFIDTETTGLSIRKDRIIEIGLIRVENNTIVDTFQTLLNPETYISPFITDITHIFPQELEAAPLFADIKERLQELLDDAVFVAHNVRFDYGFFRTEFKRIGIHFTSKHFCTAKLSRALFPTIRHHNLDSIIERYGFSCENRHRAFDDAKVLWDFYQAIQRQFPEETIQKYVKQGLKHPSYPLHLPEKLLIDLPELPGVYIFYGETGTPLYVGKSINIRERVLSHFASDYTESKEMHLSQQVRDIETIVTSGELGALLKEAQMIKKLQPLYNRKLRTSRRLVVLFSHINTDSYEEISLEEVTEINPEHVESIRGVYRSKKQAKEYLIALAKEYQLCEKILGLEKTRQGCFAYRLGNCKGACVKEENPLLYNSRCIIAFSKNKIKPWGFAGPIVITEKNIFTNNYEQFIVDKWCLLGKKTSTEDVEGVFSQEDYRFDVDTYKILVKFLDEEKNMSTITMLKNINSFF